MSWKYVRCEKKNKIATITLNRPEKYNAFAGRMREEILETVEDCCSDSSVRVIVITGAGKAFCAGGDVNEFISGKTQALADTVSNERHTMSKIVLAINAVEKPVIAAVNGVAAGGGCNLALSCDIRIASEKARFGQVFTRRGAHPDWGGIYFLPRLVGYAKAAELIFAGEVIDAEEAMRLGMVNRLVSHENLMPVTYDLAGKMAKNAPIPIAFAKRGLQNFFKMDLPQALDFESYVLDVCLKSNDFMEGFNAFLEKREPAFQGK
ncbi:MAG: enoyl-CoA hydratase/isomerase family protein [Desulfosarcina sp.]|nr:enoyl-CoA hydratase/isomerase family protein [Desulfobacterales bacterium]